MVDREGKWTQEELDALKERGRERAREFEAMSWDGAEQDYRDGQAAHHEGQPHLVCVDAIQVSQRRWRRFSTIAYVIRCECGWETRATYHAEANRLADEHAEATGGGVLQTKRGNG